MLKYRRISLREVPNIRTSERLSVTANYFIVIMDTQHRHDMPHIAPWNDDIVSGWRYCATLQLRTPLFVLQQHGRLERATPDGPPQLTDEMWHGIWVPDLGEEFAYLHKGATMASEVGPIPIDGGDYLPFLKAVRAISEGLGSVGDKEPALRNLVDECGPNGTPYKRYCDPEDLVNRVLPRVIYLLPAPANVLNGLMSLQLDTLGKLSAAPDDQLLRVESLGAKRLKPIRQFMASTTIDSTCTRILNPVFGPYTPPTSSLRDTSNVGHLAA